MLVPLVFTSKPQWIRSRCYRGNELWYLGELVSSDIGCPKRRFWPNSCPVFWPGHITLECPRLLVLGSDTEVQKWARPIGCFGRPSSDTGTKGCTIIVPMVDCLVTVIAKDKTGLEVLTIRRYHQQPYCLNEDFSKPLPKLGPIVRRRCLSLEGLLGENANIEGIILLLLRSSRSDRE